MARRQEIRTSIETTETSEEAMPDMSTKQPILDSTYYRAILQCRQCGNKTLVAIMHRAFDGFEIGPQTILGDCANCRGNNA